MLENDIILWVLNTWADSELIMTIPRRKIKLSTQKRGSHQLSLIITSSTNTGIWVWAFPISHSISPSYILSCTKLSIHNQKQKCPYWSWSLGYYDPSLNQYTRVKKKYSPIQLEVPKKQKKTCNHELIRYQSQICPWICPWINPVPKPNLSKFKCQSFYKK